MSTIAAQTISNLAGTASTSMDNAIYGSAKAWVNFNGTGTVAIRASFNVSSITDGGTGVYTVNFTNAMPDISFAAAFAAANIGTNNGIPMLGGIAATSVSVVVVTNTAMTSAIDVSHVHAVVFR